MSARWSGPRRAAWRSPVRERAPPGSQSAENQRLAAPRARSAAAAWVMGALVARKKKLAHAVESNNSRGESGRWRLRSDATCHQSGESRTCWERKSGNPAAGSPESSVGRAAAWMMGAHRSRTRPKQQLQPSGFRHPRLHPAGSADFDAIIRCASMSPSRMMILAKTLPNHAQNSHSTHCS